MQRYGSHDELMNIHEISEKLKISFHFLTKILQVLTKGGVLKSTRGPNGGIGFEKTGDQIYLREIVEAFEGESFFDNCLLGLPDCQSNNPCPVHEFWQSIKEEFINRMESTTLAELSKLEGRISIEQLSEAY